MIAGAAVFVACYVILVMHWRGHPRAPTPLLLFAVMLAVSAALTIFQASGWGFLFTYCAACAALVTSAGFWAVVACAVLAGVCTALGGADGGTVVGFVASSAGVGLLMLVMRDLRVRNMELNEARAELADMAVAEERERFARDLHDLLGHSLSVIALKAELAGRLLADGPRRRERGRRARAGGAQGVGRGARGGQRLPPADARRRARRRPDGAVGRRHRGRRRGVARRARPGRRGRPGVGGPRGRDERDPPQRRSHCTLKVTASLTDAAVEVIDDGVAGRSRASGRPGGGGPS